MRNRKSKYARLEFETYGMNRKEHQLNKYSYCVLAGEFTMVELRKEEINKAFFPNSAHFSKEHSIQNGRKKSPFIFKTKV